MNKLSTADRARALAALVEGCSIRATARMTGVAKNTIVKLLEDIGAACQVFHDEHVVGLKTKRVQIDEIWSFVHSKEKNVQEWSKGHGDVWTWTSLDADSKLIINWRVGGRDAGSGNPFVADLVRRLTDRIQLTSDRWQTYRDAVKKAFGTDVDYAMLVKEYATERAGFARYSPSHIVSCAATALSGNPERIHVNTSYAEQQNLTMRMDLPRFTRQTNAFSKKIKNHKHAVALHFMHYNFCRVQQTLRATPAMEAGLTDHVWEIADIVALLN